MANKWIGRCTLAVLVLYWAALCTGTHLPQPPTGMGGASDKLLHYLAYAGLAFLFTAAAASQRPFTWQMLLLVFMGAIAYGGIDELSQIPIPGRYGELHDWLADALGAASGIALFGACRGAWLLMHKLASIAAEERPPRAAEKSPEGLA